MSDDDLLSRVRGLLAGGARAPEIAAALGLEPALVDPIVAALTATGPGDLPPVPGDPGGRAALGCWVSPGWSAGLTVPTRPDWPEPGEPATGPGGLVSVVVARDAGRGRTSVCGYLVDVYCLGVKNSVGPRAMDRSALAEFAGAFFTAYQADPVEVPVDLLRHLVFGAIEYAQTLGFAPAADADFAATAGHLGEWRGPSAITFGRNGTPCYVAGDADDVDHVLRTLAGTVGAGNFEYVPAAGRLPGESP
ncbi:MAG TPA: helix-turn-helix domain-containing protein [Pseudonocardiaceae bacterium]|jgi:hypothetical protein|nr:helix-turn-helix domain-containing protein [Pseudonocardiaceae bacterium]